MFCKNCGKELSDGALLCPACGEPTGSTAKPVKQEEVQTETSKNLKGIAAAGMTLSLIAFVTGIIFGTFLYIGAVLYLYLICYTSILPALVALVVGIYVLASSKDAGKLAKTFSIVSIVFAAVVLLFLFLAGCVLVAIY